MKTTGKAAAVDRAPLSRELVLKTALALIDADGLAKLSMRGLGAALGVEAMSLYNHVAGKDDVIDGALDLVVAEIAVPAVAAEPGAWRPAMKERAASARLAFERHPWAGALLDSRLSSQPARLGYYDAVLGALCRAGFALADAARAFSVLDCYVYGFGLQRRHMAAAASTGPAESTGPADSSERAAAFRAALPAADYPYLARMAEAAAASGYDAEADFAFGLDLILDGLERRLAAAAASAEPPAGPGRA
jgi:AcrR family transcriptional regulator